MYIYLGPNGEMVMNAIPGEAGVDYATYNSVPDTGFSCSDQVQCTEKVHLTRRKGSTRVCVQIELYPRHWIQLYEQGTVYREGTPHNTYR